MRHLAWYVAPGTWASSGAGTVIEGSLHSTPNTSFTLEFFSNTQCNSSGYGEGESPIGTTVVTTDAAGDATFADLLASWKEKRTRQSVSWQI